MDTKKLNGWLSVIFQENPLDRFKKNRPLFFLA
jgi:hypothetical protein